MFGLDDGMALDVMFDFKVPALEACLGMEDTLGKLGGVRHTGP